jgi:2-polyprenyl-3-methyl-5-hydroxy-6-metoxy-1,4-benzoquinol methylase
MKESDIRPLPVFSRYLELVRQDGERLLESRTEFVPVRCPGCGAEEGETAFEKEGFRYESCRLCASLYVSPRPTAAMLQQSYADSAAVKYWATHFFKETVEARRTKVFRPRAEAVAEMAKADEFLQTRTFVDVGAGYGTFLEEVSRLQVFRTLVGIEPASALAAICREKGFAVLEAYIESVAAAHLQADLVTAYEVIEHVFDPLAFFRGAAGVLRPGGRFLFTTLTVSGFDIQVLWDQSKAVSPPQHLNLLSALGVRRLIERSGLAVEDLSTPGRLDLDIVKNTAAENAAVTLPRFVKRIVEAGHACEEDFQVFLREHGLSSHLRGLAIKERQA